MLVIHNATSFKEGSEEIAFVALLLQGDEGGKCLCTVIAKAISSVTGAELGAIL